MRKRKTLWHNYRAFQSPKMQALIAKYGFKFYGYYWLLIEMAARTDLQIIKKFFADLEQATADCLQPSKKARRSYDARISMLTEHFSQKGAMLEE